MIVRLKQFLDLRGERLAGRWFSVVVAIGALAIGYSVITDWELNSVGQRVKGIFALLMACGLAVAHFIWAPRSRSEREVDPPA